MRDFKRFCGVICFTGVLLGMLGHSRTANASNTFSLPVADCTTQCGSPSQTIWQGMCSGYADCNTTSTYAVYAISNCTATMENIVANPGSVAWDSDEFGSQNCCSFAPNSGTASAGIAVASTISESATSNWTLSFSLSESAEAQFNMWLIGDTKIGVTATQDYATGKSNTESDSVTDTESCGVTVNPCNNVILIRSAFARADDVTGDVVMNAEANCYQDQNAYDWGQLCNYPQVALNVPWSKGNSAGYCKGTVTLTPTKEKVGFKCFPCSMDCVSPNPACCLTPITQDKLAQEYNACVAKAHLWP